MQVYLKLYLHLMLVEELVSKYLKLPQFCHQHLHKILRIVEMKNYILSRNRKVLCRLLLFFCKFLKVFFKFFDQFRNFELIQ